MPGFVLSGFGDEISEDLGEQLDLLSREGVRHLELRSAWGRNILDLATEEIDRAVTLFADRGMSVSAIASPVGKVPIETEEAAEAARLGIALERARQFGARYVRVFSFYVPRAEESRYEDEVVRRLATLTRMAERSGATLLLENDDDLFAEKPERMLQVVERVGSPHLRVIFDPGNFVKAGLRPFDDAYPILADHVEYVHVKDARLSGGPMCLPGEGDGQIGELLAELHRRGYRGFLSLEPHLAVAGRSSGFSGPEPFAEAIRALKRLLPCSECESR